MADDSERMERAGDYVLGAMSDGERQRAERDLEIDPTFRQAVVEAAERLQMFETAHEPVSPDLAWNELKARLAQLPQMRTAPSRPTPQHLLPVEKEEADAAPVTFGRRRSDWVKPTLQPAPVARPLGLHAIPGKRALLLAACLIAAFGLGYVAGVSSMQAPWASSNSATHAP